MILHVAWVGLLVFLLSAAGCGDDGEGDVPPAVAVPGTSVLFDWNADLSDPARFFDFPYPSDLRLGSEGRPDLRGYPIVGRNPGIRTAKAIAGQRPGFPTTTAAYFQFSAPVAPQEVEEWIAAERNAPILLIDVDPASPRRGELLPVIVDTPPPDPYVSGNLLAVAAVPGVVLRPGRRFAFVVRRGLTDAAGALLGVPLELVQLSAGETPAGPRGEELRGLYEPLWETLDHIGVDRADVAAATVFKTGDVVADFAHLAERVVAAFDIEIEDLALDPDDGVEHPRFCELHGSAVLPQFQRGVPPYDTDGLFEYGSDGLPIVQREEVVPLAITIPRTEMPPDGYPLVMYFHGTDGLSTQVVDRGPVGQPGDEPASGEGPAHVLAAHGFATFGAALPLNPERFVGAPGISSRTYLNLDNLGAYPDTFRQGTIEQRLLIEALGRLRIDPDWLAGCDGPSLPAGTTSYRLRTDPMYAMGQSLGGQFVNMVGAVEPRIAAVVPTGSGGYWSKTVLVAEIAPGIPSPALIALLLGTFELPTHLHPGLQLVQTAFEAAEPVVYAARLAKSPLQGHPARSIYQPVGIDDPGFPNPIYDAMALASGTQQAGPILWPGLQQALGIEGRDGLVPYPVSGNLTSDDGEPYTGVVVQYEGDDILDAHHIFAQLDGVKHQYGCFFATAESGKPTVPAPAGADSACE